MAIGTSIGHFGTCAKLIETSDHKDLYSPVGSCWLSKRIDCRKIDVVGGSPLTHLCPHHGDGSKVWRVILFCVSVGWARTRKGRVYVHMEYADKYA